METMLTSWHDLGEAHACVGKLYIAYQVGCVSDVEPVHLAC